MFKVICVDNKIRNYSHSGDILSRIKEGSIYEVYDERLGRGTDGTIELVYYLTGINERPKGLAANRFIKISDIDEIQLVNNKQKEYA